MTAVNILAIAQMENSVTMCLEYFFFFFFFCLKRCTSECPSVSGKNGECLSMLSFVSNLFSTGFIKEACDTNNEV